MSEGYLAKDYNITETGVSFDCSNEARARVYDRCCALAKENIKHFGDRREFIAAISHEMKTPLTGIVGAVDAINNGALENAEYKARCIETLTSQSERLHLLLVNFLPDFLSLCDRKIHPERCIIIHYFLCLCLLFAEQKFYGGLPAN